MNTLAPTSAPPAAPDAQDSDAPLVSVVIPCLNEAENIESCVKAALGAIERMGVPGEVVVADNNSEDDSVRLAQEAGAHVVIERRRGYGSAYLAGFAASKGRYIVMADADLTYDFDEIPHFVEELQAGAELVMGDRMDNIQPGAMPWLHRYIGNPILTGLLNLFFRTGISDAHCGMRALRREVLPRLDLRTTGMEFASEMVIRASKENLRIARALAQPPVHLSRRRSRRHRHADHPDRRDRSEPVRTRLGCSRDHRRSAADDRWHAGARAGAVRARVWHLLHGREGSVVRSNARALPARARSAAWGSVHARRRRIGGRHPRELDRARLRLALL
jgi:glycosyltransferase involved in cell wall biosynthesis